MSRSYVLFSCALMFGALSVALAQKDAQQKPMDAERGPVEVPIGSILIWWGKAAEIPEGFEVCDGLPVTTRDAVLKGKKPDLQQKFVRGAKDWRTFVPEAFVGGGSNSVTYDPNQSINVTIPPVTLVTANLPAHTHPLTGMDHHVVNDSNVDLDGSSPSSVAHSHYVTTAANGSTPEVTAAMVQVPTVVSAIDNESQAAPTTPVPYLASSTDRSVSVATWPRLGAAKIRPHPSITGPNTTSAPTPLTMPATASLNLPARDNRPPYLDMVFIIRVK